MKKILSLAVVLVLLISAIIVQSSVAAEESFIKIIVDGNEFKASQESQMINGTTYVPLFPFCQALGASVNLFPSDSGTKYKISKAEFTREIELLAGDKAVSINGITKKLEYEPLISKSDLMISVVFITEELGGKVVWDEGLKAVVVKSHSPITFTDVNLDAAVRDWIKKPDGDIFKYDVNSIQMLSISNKNITDISELEYFESLSYLDLSGNTIKDVSPLGNLRKLSVLLVKDNPIEDYSHLLSCYDTLQQRDFEIQVKFNDPLLESVIRQKLNKTTEELKLQDLKNITELTADAKRISDLTGIQYLYNLTSLNLSNNKISNLGPLKYLTKLESLILSANLIEDLTPLQNLTNLQKLDLYNNNIVDVSALRSLFKLTDLNLFYNKVRDITPIFNLTNLQTLVLANNDIANINGIQNLINLKQLYIKDNVATDFSPLSGMSGLVADVEIPEPTPTPVVSPTPIVTASPINSAGPIATGELPPKIVLRYYIEKPFYYVNDERKEMDTVPVNKNGRIFLPIRTVSDEIRATVAWDDAERKVTIQREGKIIELWVEKKVALVNGMSQPIDEAPFIQQGRTVLPVRFVSENLGFTVRWNPDLQEATMIYPSEQ